MLVNCWDINLHYNRIRVFKLRPSFNVVPERIFRHPLYTSRKILTFSLGCNVYKSDLGYCFCVVIWLVSNVHNNFQLMFVSTTSQHYTNPMPVQCWVTVAGAGQHPFNTGIAWHWHGIIVFMILWCVLMNDVWLTVIVLLTRVWYC